MTSENLEEYTLNEKRHNFLAQKLLEANEEKKRQEVQEKIASKEKYEKMKSAFSHLLKNANNETTSANSNFDLSDESLSQPAPESNIRGDETLSNRQVLFVPKIKDSSQKQGKVVVKICVNSAGDVISSKYTQNGSTTTDGYLVDLATKNARRYKFSKSTSPRQCGIVNIVFDVR